MGSLIFYDQTTENTKIFLSVFLKNKARQYGGVIAVTNSTTNFGIEYSVFGENRADDGGCLYIWTENEYFSIKNSMFFGGVSKNGAVLFLRESNSQILIENSYIISNTGNTGGALYIDSYNLFIVLANCILSENKADWGGGIFLNIGNEVSGVNLLLEKNLANSLGGTFYFSENNTALFENISIAYSSSLVYGGVLFSNKSSTIKIFRSSIDESFSRIGVFFYVGAGSNLELRETYFLGFNSQFNLSELFRIDGHESVLNITKSYFKAIKDIFIIDYGQLGVVLLKDSILYYVSTYSLNGLLFLDSHTSKYFIFGNQFLLQKPRTQAFDFFINLLGNESTLELQDNHMDYNQFLLILNCKRLENNLITIKNLELKRFLGSLIHVNDFSSSNTTELLSLLYINNCTFDFIGQTNYHFISLKSVVVLQLNRSVFYLSDKQTFSLIFNNLNGTSYQQYMELKLYFCLIESKSFGNSESIHPNMGEYFGLIHSENAFKFIGLERSMFRIGKKSYSNLLFLKGDIDLVINTSKILANLFNYTSSQLLTIFFQTYFRVNIERSLFLHNRVVYGGLISLISESEQLITNVSINLNNNIIEDNLAVNGGGLIFINASFLKEANLMKLTNNIESSFDFACNQIDRNRANVGTLVFWMGFNAPPIYTLLKIVKNRNYSDPKEIKVATPINFIKISDESDVNLDNAFLINNKELIQSYKIKEKIVNSEKLNRKFFFCIPVYDQYQQLLYATSETFLNASNSAGSLFSSLRFDYYGLEIKIVYHKGMYCANQFIFNKDYSELEGTLVNVTFDPFKYSAYFSFLNATETRNFSIFFEMDECKVGEVAEGESCIPCERNKFSEVKKLLSSVDCIFCNDYDDFFCYGANLRSPKRNFWRLSNNSKSFLRCPGTSCLGDQDFANNFTQRECYNCFLPGSEKTELIYSFASNHSAIGICKYPYQGILCTECKPGYGYTGKYRCGDCSSYLVYLKQFLMLLVKLFLFFYSNWKAIKTNLDHNKSDPELLHTNYKNAYLLKILFKHFTMLSVLKSLPLDLDATFDETFGIFMYVSPTEDFEVFSFACLLNKLGIELPAVYVKTLLNAAFFFLSLLFIFILLYKLKHRKDKLNKGTVFSFIKTYLIRIALIFFLDNIVALLGPYVKILFFINVGDENTREERLLNDLSLYSGDKLHQIFIFSDALPIIGIFGIAIPLYLLIKLLLARKNGNFRKINFIKNFGYFVFPYRHEVIYFEALIIFNKIILVVFKDFMSLSVIGNSQLFAIMAYFVYLLSFYVLQYYLSPYKETYTNTLQKNELYSLVVSISNTIAALFWTLIETNKDQKLSLLLLVYVLTTNLLFLLKWLYNYSYFINIVIKAASNAIKTKLRKSFSRGQLFSPIKTTGSIKAGTNIIHIDTPARILSSPMRMNISNQKKNQSSYNDLLKMNEALIREIAFLTNFNKELIQNIRFLKEKVEINRVGNIYLLESHEFNTAGNIRMDSGDFPLEDLNEKVAFDSENEPLQTENLDNLKLMLVSKNLCGEGFNDHYIKLNLLVLELSLEKIKICTVKCLQTGWDICLCKVNPKENELELHLKKNSIWLDEPFEQNLCFEVEYAKRTVGRVTNMVATFDIQIGITDLMYFKKEVWEQSDISNLDEDTIFSFMIDPELINDIFQTIKKGARLAKANIIIKYPLIQLELCLDLKLDKKGVISVIGEVNPMLFDIISDTVKKIIRPPLSLHNNTFI